MRRREIAERRLAVKDPISGQRATIINWVRYEKRLDKTIALVNRLATADGLTVKQTELPNKFQVETPEGLMDLIADGDWVSMF